VGGGGAKRRRGEVQQGESAGGRRAAPAGATRPVESLRMMRIREEGGAVEGKERERRNFKK
jgi:hypothetical protein